MEALVRALETFWDVRFPDGRGTRWLANDPVALEAAWKTALAEGPISKDLTAWKVRCLIFIGAGDTDFLDQAQQAAEEIPSAQFISPVGLDHPPLPGILPFPADRPDARETAKTRPCKHFANIQADSAALTWPQAST